jgi:hypothetical protein
LLNPTNRHDGTALFPTTFGGEAMPTQLKLFSTNGAENFSKLEKEINDWLAAKGDKIRPVNSQTATCGIVDAGTHIQSQAVVISLWYLDPPVWDSGHH